MRKIALFVAALLLCSGAALAQNPLTMVLPDCDFSEYGGHITTAADTLWFTTLQAGAGTGLSFDSAIDVQDWYGPREIPVGNIGGVVTVAKKPVRTVLLFAMAPFSVKPWYSGRTFLRGGSTAAVENSAALSFIWVDSLAVTSPGGPASTKGVKYPCQIALSHVDSLVVTGVAEGDSVKIIVGY